MYHLFPPSFSANTTLITLRKIACKLTGLLPLNRFFESLKKYLYVDQQFNNYIILKSLNPIIIVMISINKLINIK